jgi:flagellar biosynthesis/type III secretory pathway chaperone
VSQYLDYLDRVKQSVTASDSQQLETLLSDNPIDTAAIENRNAQQLQFLQHLGYDINQQDLENWISSFDDSDLSKSYRKLKEKLQQLEKALLLNSLLVNKNQQRVRQSIRILTGNTTSAGSSTYSRQGNELNEGGGRSLARA